MNQIICVHEGERIKEEKVPFIMQIHWIYIIFWVNMIVVNFFHITEGPLVHLTLNDAENYIGFFFSFPQGPS